MFEEISYRPEKINNHAALALIKKGDIYTFQLKTPGYPVEPFVNTLCIFGGNWTEMSDKSPIDTIKREISEELPEITNCDLDEMKPFGEYLLAIPETVYGRTHDFTASVFILDTKRIGECKEGVKEDVKESDIITGNTKNLCWGYERIVDDFFDSIGKQTNIRKNGFPEIGVYRLNSDPSSPYKDREIDRYIKKPIKDNNFNDKNLFRD